MDEIHTDWPTEEERPATVGLDDQISFSVPFVIVLFYYFPNFSKGAILFC